MLAGWGKALSLLKEKRVLEFKKWKWTSKEIEGSQAVIEEEKLPPPGFWRTEIGLKWLKDDFDDMNDEGE